MKKASNSGKRYTRQEMIEILSDPPTPWSVAKHAARLDRSEPAIILVYRKAMGHPIPGDSEDWPLVESVAKQLGWTAVLNG